MKTDDVAIVGAGPAGLAAAREAVVHGLSVTVLDDNDQPGGQYFRQLPRQFARAGRGRFDSEHARARRLFEVLEHPGVRYLPGSVVWDSPEPGLLAYAAGAESGRIRADAVIIAAGATDRALPFPGWTLPGVITAGGSQNLIKGQAVRPGDRVVVAGNGPLLLVVAMNLLRAGATPSALVEAAPIIRRAWSHAMSLVFSPADLTRALAWRLRLAAAGVPVLLRHAVVEAHGESALTAVSVAPIDEDGRVDRASTRVLDADCLVVGNGLAPSVELTRLLGCMHRYDPLLGGWTPWRSHDLETTVPGTYAVGDGAAIGGVELALAEGRCAALAVAMRRAPSPALRRRRRHLARRLARLNRFRAAVAKVFAPPRHFLELITPGTVVCRCEEVTLAELQSRAAEGAASMIQQKSTTRLGMGRCQGRFCLSSLASLVAARLGLGVEQLDWPRVRPPARPIPLGDLLHEAIPPPRLPDDPHLPRRPPRR